VIRVSDVTEAWEAWQHARRALHTTMPWTPDWLRLRMAEQDLRAAYLALVDEEIDTATQVQAGPVRQRVETRGSR
jgi:hypothetical protein